MVNDNVVIANECRRIASPWNLCLIMLLMISLLLLCYPFVWIGAKQVRLSKGMDEKMGDSILGNTYPDIVYRYDNGGIKKTYVIDGPIHALFRIACKCVGRDEYAHTKLVVEYKNKVISKVSVDLFSIR